MGSERGREGKCGGRVNMGKECHQEKRQYIRRSERASSEKVSEEEKRRGEERKRKQKRKGIARQDSDYHRRNPGISSIYHSLAWPGFFSPIPTTYSPHADTVPDPRPFFPLSLIVIAHGIARYRIYYFESKFSLAILASASFGSGARTCR